MINKILAMQVGTKPEVGMGCTILLQSDRKAATIIDILEDKRKGNVVHVQLDRAIRTDKRGIDENQEYAYERDEEGVIYSFIFDRNKGWVAIGSKSTGLLVGERDHFYDYSY